MFYFFPSNVNVGHVKLNKPLQHWTNIRGLEPDLNIGDPEGSLAGEDLVGTDEHDVEGDLDVEGEGNGDDLEDGDRR